ncbi:MAG TPA: type II secretion system protein GspC [Gammaproteobacteria bacterium]|nr:type II secretion system protein GspC [Gammaproteobacteria bacterium]
MAADGLPIELLRRVQRYLLGHLPELVTLALVVLLAHAAADAVWQATGQAFAPPAGADRAGAPGRSASQGAGPAPEQGIKRIAARNLFGQAPPQNPTGNGPINAPETGLNLKLYGIFTSGRAGRSRAIIARGNQDEKIYGVGDQLPGNAVVTHIYPDRVIIRRNGALEALRLPHANKQDLLHGSAAQGNAGPGPGSSGGAQLAQVRNQILSNPDKLANLVRVRPVYRSGKLAGYRVYPGPDGSLFHRLGLHPGDLVKSVNGVDLDQPSKAFNLMQTLKGASQLSLVVDRGGQQKTVTVSLDN